MPVSRLTKPTSLVIGVLSALVLLATVYSSGVGDGDLYWQMTYGRYLLDSHQLIPNHQAFTWSQASNEIIYCAWLSEISLELLYRAGGLPAIYLLRYGLMLLIVAGAIVLSRMNRAPAPLVAFGSTLLLVGSFGGADLKPEMFSVFWLALCTITLYAFKTRPHGRLARVAFALTPLYILLWVNSHGGFVFASLLYGGFLIGEGLNSFRRAPGCFGAQEWRLTGWSMAGTLLAILLTPYGHRYPVQLIQDRLVSSDNLAMMNYVAAWAPSFDSQLEGMMNRESFLCLVLLCGFGLWRSRRLDFTYLFHNLLFGGFFCLYARTTYLWPMVAVASTFYLLREVRWEGAGVRWAGFAALCATLFLTLRMAYFSVYLPVPHNHWGIGPGQRNPVVAAELLKQLPVDLRIANDYDSGGYLMWALYPQRRIMIDPRGFPFRSWFSEYTEFAGGQAAPEFLRERNCKAVFVSLNRVNLTRALKASPEWRAVLLEPAGTTFLHLSVSDPPSVQALQQQAFGELRNVRTNSLLVANAIRLGRLDWAKGFLERAELIAGRGESTRTQRTLYEAVVAVHEGRHDEAIGLYEDLLSRRELGSYNTLKRLYRFKIANSPGEAETYRRKLKELEDSGL